ncbi:unnamed protein product [Camellia sinensis]
MMEQKEVSVSPLNKTTSDESKKTTQEAAEGAITTTTTTITAKRAVECIYGSNEVELNKIRLMRAFVQTQDTSSKNVVEPEDVASGAVAATESSGRGEAEAADEDDLMIKRFLWARNVDIQKALAMFLKNLKWRRTFVPNGFIPLQRSEMT